MKLKLSKSLKTKKFKVYLISCKAYYIGYSLVSAENEKEANEFIENFKKLDLDNKEDSKGYYTVDEDDALENLFSDIKGIIFYGISYTG